MRPFSKTKLSTSGQARLDAALASRARGDVELARQRVIDLDADKQALTLCGPVNME